MKRHGYPNPAAIKARSRDANVVAFLASHAARWITSTSLAVDGGLSLRKLDGHLMT
jgi:NAD(P)-dependent dehydrogenase (short-subunit alcohol dehydrogenase family)